MLDADQLVRALASGRRKGQPAPVVAGREVQRIEVRVVDLKAGRHLQVTSYDATQAHTSNHALGEARRPRWTRCSPSPSPAGTSTRPTRDPPAPGDQEGRAAAAHLRAQRGGRGLARPRPAKDRLLAEDDPVLVALGISDAQGRVKPTRQAKYRQVEEFLRLLDASLDRGDGAGAGAHAHRPTTRCGSSTSGAATPTSPSPRTASSPPVERVAAGCRCG